MQLVSEVHRFGGTIDAYAEIDGKAYLVDFKTCKAVYPEMATQVAGGYAILMQENGNPVDKILILRIGRDESEGFEEINIGTETAALHMKRFLICRDLYDINQKIRNS
jgi:hypothetical protein